MNCLPRKVGVRRVGVPPAGLQSTLMARLGLSSSGLPSRQQCDGRPLHHRCLPDRPERLAAHRRPDGQGDSPVPGGEAHRRAHSLPPVLPPRGPPVTRAMCPRCPQSTASHRFPPSLSGSLERNSCSLLKKWARMERRRLGVCVQRSSC